MAMEVLEEPPAAAADAVGGAAAAGSSAHSADAAAARAASPAAGSPPPRSMEQLQAVMRALAAAAGVQPRVYARARTQEEVQAEDLIPEWGNLKRGIRLPHHMLRSLATAPVKRDSAELLEGMAPRAKPGGRTSKPGGGSGRTFTSRFRGVHQTFPTRRWEAQFRRNGKPTSLGCFDREEDAARAYDRMMLWVEMHGAGVAAKAGVTNFDVAQYAEDLPWLAGVTQDELIDALRTEGRKQASARARPGATPAPPHAPPHHGGAPGRGGSATPDPGSDWAGDDDSDGAGGGGARKRRRGGGGGGGRGGGRGAPRPRPPQPHDGAGGAAGGGHGEGEGVEGEGAALIEQTQLLAAAAAVAHAGAEALAALAPPQLPAHGGGGSGGDATPAEGVAPEAAAVAAAVEAAAAAVAAAAATSAAEGAA
ncbi:MAG: hypothetical protein J3K34DRAFT_526974 [Monoraphidium minutum]|nr:MAG: hypothetical protein J3K34DRAFT_526974 [Monoraphidium minutum]